jgi:hypothetical protein
MCQQKKPLRRAMRPLQRPIYYTVSAARKLLRGHPSRQALELVAVIRRRDTIDDNATTRKTARLPAVIAERRPPV